MALNTIEKKFNNPYERQISDKIKFNLGYLKGYTDRCNYEFKTIFNLIREYNNEETTSNEHKDEYINIIMEIIGKNISLCSTGDFIMNLLPYYYNIIKPQEVYKFLEMNNHLKSFLIEAAQEIRKVFGDNIRINLIKEVDPEISELTKLVAYIDTSDWESQKALTTLEKFEDEWYFDNMHREKGKFDIDVL